MSTLKSNLYQLCLTFIQKRIENITYSMEQARQASNDDTKSSAGDKYETTREMMQQEISRNQMQLHEAGKLKHALEAINPNTTSNEVKNGSLVITNTGNFYISVSAGQLKINDITYFAVSPFSPIAKVLMGLKTGQKTSFNGKDMIIQNIM